MKSLRIVRYLMTGSAQAVMVVSLVLACISPALAQQATPVPEAPSTVQADYVEPSSMQALKSGQKIADLYTRNTTEDYVLQRLSQRTYWFQRQFYTTIFYVGDEGVLLFDPLRSRGEFIQKAIASVTELPVRSIVYTHNHADHIGDAGVFLQAASKAGIELQIVASEATASKMDYLGSELPKPTDVVTWPRGSFKFESLIVDMHGFERGAHTDDHAIWQLASEKIVHLPDFINPDQPPFWRFAGSENFVYYQDNLDQLAKLNWTYLSGGHGNVGSHADVEFYQRFLTDLRLAVGKARGEVEWGAGIDASRTNAHTPFLPAWLDAVAKKATDSLRPKYGKFYGFEAATPANAKMVAKMMHSYK